MARMKLSTLILWICLLSQGVASQGTQIRKRSLQEEQSVEGMDDVDIPAGSPSMAAMDPSPVTTDDAAASDDAPVDIVVVDSSPAAAPSTEDLNNAEEAIEDGDADLDEDEQGERHVLGDNENDEDAPASSPNAAGSPVTTLSEDTESTTPDNSDNENMDWNEESQFDDEELEESTEDDTASQR